MGTMNTDTGRLLYERAKDGAFGGLSIGYKPKENGVVYGQKGDAHRRILTKLDLREISLVDSPSNAMSRISEFKLASPSDIARILHAGGVADRLAKKMAALAYKAVPGMEDFEDENDEPDQVEELKALLDQRERLRLAVTLRKNIRDWSK
jgi:hypothetical protein